MMTSRQINRLRQQMMELYQSEGSNGGAWFERVCRLTKLRQGYVWAFMWGTKEFLWPFERIRDLFKNQIDPKYRQRKP